MNQLSALTAIIQSYAEVLKKPGVISVRPGYRMENGWPTKEPAIVVVTSQTAGPVEFPPEVGGVKVDARRATAIEEYRYENPETFATLADKRPELKGGAFPGIDPVADDLTSESTQPMPEGAKAKPHIPYTAPKGFPLSPVEGVISILCHASPDAGWPTLREFLSKTEKTLTVGLYDFTSEHILDEVEKDLAGKKTLEITLDNPPLNPSHDQSDSDSLRALDKELGNSLKAAWALVRSNKAVQRWIFPTAYHIKVAVRDSQSVWLSSGNWNNSNQPDMDPIGHPNAQDQQTARKSDRDWHIVIDHEGLAKTFEAYLKNDYDVAAREEGKGAETLALEPAGELPPSFEIEARAIQWQFFAPLQIDNEPVTITPLLTPDKDIYQPRMLELLNSAKKSLFIQLQYIHPSENEQDADFNALIDAVARKIKAKIDVRIIVSQYQTSQGWLDRLQAAGVDLDYVKIQNGVHNKGFVIDSSVVALGSENWSGDGVLRNRDASVIIANETAARYYEKIFLHDWDNVARQSVN
jgi:phosphatidylserine/phosphatidylglycerophosphate/cardiolipin synthase-like enzyme